MGLGRIIKSGLATFTLIGAIALASCGDKHHSNPTGTGSGTGSNHAPVLVQPTDDSTYENSLYEKVITMSDADGDNMTPYLITAPAGASISKTSPTTAKVSWTPNDNQSDLTHPFQIGVSDPSNASDSKSWNVYAGNVENVNGSVIDIFSGTSLENAVVTIDAKSCNTDNSGNYTITNLPDGTYVISVAHPNYHNSQWNITTNKAKASSGKTSNVTYEVVPKTFDMELFDYYYRRFNGETSGDTDLGPGNGVTQRPTDEDSANWIVNICTDPAIGSGIPITQAMIDQRKDAFLNHFPTMSRGKLNFTFNEDNSSNLSPYGTPRTTYSFWNDNFPEGGHAEYLENNNLLANRNVTNTSTPKRVDYHEEYQNFGARGEETPTYPNPPTLTETVLDPYRTEDTFSTWDNQAMFYNFSVPIGTASPDNRTGDINE